MNFAQDGFELVDSVFNATALIPLKSEINQIVGGIRRGGLRNAEQRCKAVPSLLEQPAFRILVQHYLPDNAQLVRAIIFTKSQENNWLVSWHQDKTVSVSTHFSACDWGPWSCKDGVIHVQPPLSVLQSMVTFRIHLDDSTAQNGCLKLLPGSHAEGVLSQQQINHYDKRAAVNCIGTAGSVLVMRPLVLHASGKVSVPAERYVLHVEYCSYTLPDGVTWCAGQQGQAVLPFSGDS